MKMSPVRKIILISLFTASIAQLAWILGTPADLPLQRISFHKLPRQVSWAAQNRKPASWIFRVTRRRLDRRILYDVLMKCDSEGKMDRLILDEKGIILLEGVMNRLAVSELPEILKKKVESKGRLEDAALFWEHTYEGQKFYSATILSEDSSEEIWFNPGRL